MQRDAALEMEITELGMMKEKEASGGEGGGGGGLVEMLQTGGDNGKMR